MLQTGRNTKPLIAIIVFLLLSNIALLAFFLFMNKPGKKHDRNPNAFYESLKKDAGFDEQQLAGYQKLRDEHMAKVKPLFDDVRTAKENYYALLSGPSSDSTEAVAVQKIGENQVALDREVYLHFKRVRALSKPEQLPQFDTLFKKVVEKITGRGRKQGARKKENK